MTHGCCPETCLGRPAGRARVSCLPVGTRGFSLVELLLACALGGLVLAASWSWLFTSVAAGREDGRRLEAATSLAYVERLTTAELRRACVLLAAPAPGCSQHSLVFEVVRSDLTTETVSYVWNPGTQVLWRKAAGSHLASGVAGFAVRYFDAAGDELAGAGAVLSPADLARVRSLRLAITLTCGSDVLEASWDVTPRVMR